MMYSKEREGKGLDPVSCLVVSQLTGVGSNKVWTRKGREQRMAWQVGCFIYDTLVLIKRDGWGWESRDNIGDLGS